MTVADTTDDDCAMYLKEGETPRRRMDRFHSEVLGLMRELERVSGNRDMWRGQCGRQAEELTSLRAALAAKTVETDEMTAWAFGLKSRIEAGLAALSGPPDPQPGTLKETR